MNTIELQKSWENGGWRRPLNQSEAKAKKVRQLIAYYRKIKKPVNTKHRLYEAQSIYCNKMGEGYVREVRMAAIKVGYGTKIGIAARELDTYYRRYRRPVPRGHKLFWAQRAYCSKGSEWFRADIRASAKKVGFAKRFARVKRQKNMLRNYYARWKRPVPCGHPLHKFQDNYCVPNRPTSDASLRKAAMKVGYASGTGRPARS